MSQFPVKSVIGLTGGIACGKSTALKFFMESGIGTISTDDIVARLYRENEELIDAVSSRWNSRDIFEDGKIAKSKVAQIIFNSKAEREWLESIIHPIVRKEWTDIVSKSDKKTHVVEIPLLFEKELQADFRWVIAVYASLEVRQVRLEQRGLTKEEACLRINNQLPLEEKVRHADFVFLANSSESFLKRQVHNFVKNCF